MPKLSIGLMLALAIGGLTTARPASACARAISGYTSAPPRPSQAEERRHHAYEKAEMARADAIEQALRPFNEQKSLWQNSEQVFTALIVSVEPRQIETFWGNSVEIQDVELRPMTWLKGQRQDQTFKIGISKWSDCGPDKRWDALSGKLGDEFVVFVEGGPPSNETVREAINVFNIVDPEVNIALEAAQAQ